MKSIIKIMTGTLFVGMMFSACSPEEFDGANQNGIPSMDGVDYTVSVDQETNTMTAMAPVKDGEYPVWLINGASYSTLPTVTWSNKIRGTYTIELRMANRNGFSQSSVQKTFTFNETKVDFTSYFSKLDGKQWRIDNSVKGHLACGPSGTSGTEWWSANVDEKKDNGIYDDRLTFQSTSSTGGDYTYSSGEDGLTFVNNGTRLWGTQDADWDASIAPEQTSSFTLESGTWTDADGKTQDAVFLVLADNTLFPYISADEQYQQPRFRIEGLTSTALNLVYDNGKIAWHFTFTSKPVEKGFEGYDANSDFNLFKNAAKSFEFYYAPGWAQIDNPAYEENGNDWTFTFPAATSDQWQNQIKWNTDISTSSANHYDFSAQLTPNKDMSQVTVKLTNPDDANVFYFADRVDLKAGETYIFYKSDMEGLDISNLQLVVDCGGNPENSTLEVANIVVKDHANDDGTVLPAGSDDNINWCDVNSDLNIGKAYNTLGEMTFWWADDTWSQIADPQWSYKDGVYTITASVQPGGSEWMAQSIINGKSSGADVQLQAGQAYDISYKISSTVDLPRYTVKVADYKDDNNIALYYNGAMSLPADELTTVKIPNQTMSTDSPSGKLIFDFGGVPQGAVIQISDIIIQKHNPK